mgnify:FL=1
MEYILNTDNIELGLNESSDGIELCLTLNDKHGHYEDDFKLSNDQAYDLLQGLKSIESRLHKNEFD